MTSDNNATRPIIKAASVCVWRGEEVLLVQRGKALGYGKWSLPGGKAEAGETAVQTAARELLEETGITACLSHHVGDFSIEAGNTHFLISCFTGPYEAGMAVANSDAMALCWVNMDDLASYDLAPNILEAVSIAKKLTSV